MKLFLGTIVLSIVLSFAPGFTGFISKASADDVAPGVKITSFESITADMRIGEVCGVATGLQGESVRLNVIADPKTHNPGNYHVITGHDGTFCELIHTYTGTVEVSVMGGRDIAPATAKMKNGANKKF